MSGPLLQRQRKTKDPCQICYLHKDRCICALIPNLNLATRVCLVIHAKELKRTTNTGRLGLKALINSEMRIRGDDREGLDLSDLISSKYKTVMLYPSDEAVELDAVFMSQQTLPLQLIVPDGNWRQASKVHYRHKELSSVQRVRLKSTTPMSAHMRLETVPDGMATLEAMAHALAAIEGAEVGEALLNLYKAKLEQTLIGRGIKK
ncbi:MAG: DTW domain-containing protein [Bdellovibrionaceae bacterium]|nr:DTW domain-containing protein [Pseudobdellovibrionaceae bacterium]